MNEIEKLCDDVLKFGDLLLIAQKSHGKTHTLMNLARQFKSMKNVHTYIFEDFPKWISQFDSTAYMVVNDDDVIETEHVVDVEDFFLRHERDYSVLKGNQIKEFLRNNQNGIFLLNVRDIDRSAFFTYSIINQIYRKQYLKAYKYGIESLTEHYIFIIEESQNVFDSSTINRKLFNRLRKIFSVARNLNIHFVMCSQRLVDLNTKIRGRARLLIGQIGLDDYELKISRLLKNSKYRKNVLHLPKGVFLYPTLDSLISFPMFKQNGKPYAYQFEQPKPIEQPQPKQNFIQRFITKFKHKEISIAEEIEQQDEELNEVEEEEEFPIFDEEFV